MSMNRELYRVCRDAINKAIDKGCNSDEIFDYFIDAAVVFAELRHQHAYCRVFWHDDVDLDDAICDTMDVVLQYRCTDYAVVESTDADATFLAVLH